MTQNDGEPRKKRVNIKAILADQNLRRKLLVPVIQALQSREGIETSREQAERAYDSVVAHRRSTL